MSLISEFKAFAFKGNVVDLAVGVVIGGAFGKIVSSIVDDVLMPILGKISGGVDFSNKFVQLGGDGVTYDTLTAAKAAGVATLNYGMLLNNVITFLLVAIAIFFLIIKPMARLQRADTATPPPPPAPTKEEQLLTEIRDLLKSR